MNKDEKIRNNLYYGCIYKITNILTNRAYIGQTTQKDPWRRIRIHFRENSKSYISCAIKKDNSKNFKYEILCSCFSIEDLNYLEIFFIQYYNSLVPNGYNLKKGGEQGGKLLEETKKKISQVLIDRYKKIPSKRKGVKFTKEHCNNLSKVRKGFDSLPRKLARQKATKRQK